MIPQLLDIHSIINLDQIIKTILYFRIHIILFQTVGNKITPLVVNPGRIVLTTVTLYFQPYNNAEKQPVIKVKLSTIKRIFQRRYLLRPLGLEIEFTNMAKNKSDHIYLTFNKPEDRQKLYHKLLIAKQELELKAGQEDNVFFPTQTAERGDRRDLTLKISDKNKTIEAMPGDSEMNHPLSPVYNEMNGQEQQIGGRKSVTGSDIGK